MAKFCANCGAVMEDTDRICGQCGTPAMDGGMGQAAGVQSGASKPIKPAGSDISKYIKWAIIGVVAIVVLVIAVNVIKKFTGYNATIRTMVKALKNDDVDTLIDISSSISDEVYSHDYGNNYEKEYDNLVDNALDMFEDKVGEIKKISYEITDITETSERRLNDVKDELIDRFNMDVDGIKRIVKIDMRLTVKGDRKSNTYNVDSLYLIKEDGGWKIHYGYIPGL